MMNIDPLYAEKNRTHLMHMLINGYSFNNTINANPGAVPPSPHDMRNSALRNQIVYGNPASNQVYTVNDMAYRYTWKRGDPLIVGHLVRIH
jgi:hypothetical protein